MARGLSSQLLAAYNESQRRAQRARDAQERQWRMQQQEQLRAQRAAQRARAQYDRAALHAYQQAREGDVVARNQQLADTVNELDQILVAALAVAPFRLDQYKAAFTPPPFTPGPLGVVVPPPDPRQYQVAAPTGILARTAKARQEHEGAVAQARAAYEEHWRQAAAAEQQRQQRLAAYHAEFQRWAEGERARIEAHNQALDDLAWRYQAGEADAVLQYCTTALTASAWPASFPNESRAAWDAAACQVVIDWQLPWFDVVPRLSRYRYVKASDSENEVVRPVGERRATYRRLLARSCLRVLAELFRADHACRVESVVLNGYVRCTDPATGKEAKFYVASLTVACELFTTIDLRMADPISCIEGMRGQLSAKPDQPLAVRPVRVPESVDGVVEDQADSDDIDLLEMDPIEFEELVADLFRHRGLQVMTTARTGDQGVDIFAVEPDPISGGKVVIQVKRHRSTIAPAVVRELYGTVIAQGAAKGVLVTTSGYGPGSREFAENKPLTLIAGPELLQLLAQYGLPGRIGGLATTV